MSANDRTGVGSGSGEWQTPGDLYAKWNRRYRFNYDAFASHLNHLTPHYSTLEGTFRLFDRNAHPDNDLEDGELRPHRVSAETGLAYDWADLRVWVQPPYETAVIEPAMRRCVEMRNRAELVVALVPAATETQWFQRWVLPYAFIEWLPKRIRYIHPPFECGDKCQTGKVPHKLGEPGVGPPSGSVLALFRADSM